MPQDLRGYDEHTLADVASKAEHEDQGVFVGRTDAYAVALGGFQVQVPTGSRIKLIRIVPSPSPLVTGVDWVPSCITPAAERLLRVTRDWTTEN